jgi:hypothetical protein
MRRGEVESDLGPPSLVIGKRVLCYVPADIYGWVFFDCFQEDCSGVYVPGTGRYECRLSDRDPLVHAIRRPASDFESGLIFTLYGKVLRWGPGLVARPPGGSAVSVLGMGQLVG